MVSTRENRKSALLPVLVFSIWMPDTAFVFAEKDAIGTTPAPYAPDQKPGPTWPPTSSCVIGVVVPIPTLPLPCCSTNCEPPMVKPWPEAMVEVPVVEVALKNAKVGVEVEMMLPNAFVARS